MSEFNEHDIINIQDLTLDTPHINLLENIQPDTLTFECNNYRVQKRQAEITYDEPLFIEQFHTLVFNIHGERIVFERV